MDSKIEFKQGGSVLLEALIAILIFSFGILGIVGMHATMITHSAEAKYRSEAGFYINRLLGEMAAADRSSIAALATFQSPSGDSYINWFKDMKNSSRSVGLFGLPGVVDNPPTVTITPVAKPVGAPTNYNVTVVVQWKSPTALPTDPPHRHVVNASLTVD